MSRRKYALSDSGNVARGDVSLKYQHASGLNIVIEKFTSRHIGCGKKLQLTFLVNDSNINNPNESEINSLLIGTEHSDIIICEVRFSCKYSFSFVKLIYVFQEHIFHIFSYMSIYILKDQLSIDVLYDYDNAFSHRFLSMGQE